MTKVPTPADGYKKLKEGGMVDPGTSKFFHTGTWRTFRPVWDEKKCIHCQICTAYCPDDCILTKGKDPKTVKRTETDMRYCKGCGICKEVCPVKCIEMKPESEFND